MSLRSKLVVRLSLGLIIGAALLFIPAGSWKFWQGWAFLGVTFIPSILAYLYFYKHDPQLMERRLQSKEKVSEQKLLLGLAKPFFLAIFLLPGFDYRLVRHPLYSGSQVIWLATPLALGSYIAWPAFALLIPFYVFRLLNEEKVLRQELPGYSEYCRRTRFRLVPFVW